MVIETVVTTLEANGDPNFAAMGVVWGEETITIRPFTNTRTYRNLVRSGEAVVNVTDNVLIFAKSALSRETFASFPAKVVRGVVLADACQWREVRRRPRPGAGRDAVAPGRADIGVAVVLAEIERLDALVRKTGGADERAAMEFIRECIGRDAVARAGARQQ